MPAMRLGQSNLYLRPMRGRLKGLPSVAKEPKKPNEAIWPRPKIRRQRLLLGTHVSLSQFMPSDGVTEQYHA